MTGIKKAWLIFLLFSSQLWAEQISAPIQQANWLLIKGESNCQLVQEIPLYGTAEFIHQSGSLLRFSVKEPRYKPQIVKASLFIDTPPWMHETASAQDYLVTLDGRMGIQDIPRLSVYGETAEIMLDALSAGYSPRFSYIRANSQGELPETQVTVQAVNFISNYQQFSACRKNFLPHGLKAMLAESMFFKAGSVRLNAAILSQLKKAARYIKEVKGSQIIITSSTSIAGIRDKKWFLKRAKVISAKLTGLGVDKAKIKIRSGFFSASADNKMLQLNIFGPDALTTLYYKKGSLNISAAEKQRLNLLVRYSREFLPSARIIVKSHTDAKGRRASNLKVSQKRGAAVKDYLISQGLAEDKIVVKAYGESRPVKSNRFPTGRAQNRRVNISFAS